MWAEEVWNGKLSLSWCSQVSFPCSKSLSRCRGLEMDVWVLSCSWMLLSFAEGDERGWGLALERMESTSTWTNFLRKPSHDIISVQISSSSGKIGFGDGFRIFLKQVKCQPVLSGRSSDLFNPSCSLSYSGCLQVFRRVDPSRVLSLLLYCQLGNCVGAEGPCNKMLILLRCVSEVTWCVYWWYNIVFRLF